MARKVLSEAEGRRDSLERQNRFVFVPTKGRNVALRVHVGARGGQAETDAEEKGDAPSNLSIALLF
jgi:hypothetical protein